jgi:branched-chain amino acid aminotransferase
MPSDLESADEVFITSTTRQLLPVRAVKGLKIHQRGQARERLQTAFSAYFDDYVSRAQAAELAAGAMRRK